MHRSEHGSKHGSEIPIWFFVGVLLVVYGVLIGGYGVYAWVVGRVAPVALAYLHAPVWWGAILLILGIFYCVKFAPGKSGKPEKH
jgi:hypothetical protein